MEYITLKFKKEITHKELKKYELLISKILHCATIFVKINNSDKYIKLENRVIDIIGGYLKDPNELSKNNNLFSVVN